MLNDQKDNYRIFLITTLFLYALTSVPLLMHFRHQLNPDGISYISIAHKYASGDFGSAINGLWSPMYSWLLAPLLAIGVDAQLSAKLLNLLFGLLTVIATYGLTRKLELGKLSTNLVLVCTAAVALSFANSVITSDLLSVLLLLIYFNVIFDKDYSAGIKQGVFCGILGAFAYFSKAYMLTFFIGHFVLINILRLFMCRDTDEKKRTVINMLCGIFVFMALCSPWILLLSSKYEKFTITNAGAFNMALVSPGFDDRLQYTDGFMPPANSSATNFMEDPHGLNMPKWSPFESSESFKYYISHNFENNVRELLRHLDNFSPLFFAIFVATGLLVLKPLRILSHSEITALFILTSCLVFPVGYILVVFFERYVWLMCFLLILMAGFVTDRLIKSGALTKPAIILLCSAFVGPFVYMQTKALRHYDIDFVNSAYRAGSLLQNEIGEQSKIASDGEYPSTLFISYHLSSSYYGISKPLATSEKIVAELEKYEIDYYIVWQESDVNSKVLANFEEITPPDLKKPKVYRIKK